MRRIRFDPHPGGGRESLVPIRRLRQRIHGNRRIASSGSVDQSLHDSLYSRFRDAHATR